MGEGLRGAVPVLSDTGDFCGLIRLLCLCSSMLEGETHTHRHRQESPEPVLL